MKTNLMKSILHLKDDTEYQIPLREAEKNNRAEVGTTAANPEVNAGKETEAEKAANREKVDDKKKINDKKEAVATQSQDDSTVNKKTEEISQEEVNNENDPALDNLEEENPNQEHSNTENSSNDTPAESAPQVDTAKAALDKMKKLASQKGVIHPSLFISNFSKILGLMERAMQLQVKESGSATEESGSVTKEKASKTAEQAETTAEATEEKASETTEKTELPAEGKQGELNGNTNNNRS